MVGIPDGLGAFDNNDGTFTVLMNHELGSTAGVFRAHGAKGSFVSKWIIRKDDLQITSGEDLIHDIATWNPSAGGSWNTPAQGIALNRLCSANLPPVSSVYYAASGLGYSGHIFMSGEESGAEGRAFAHLMNGTSYELPALGKMSFENVVAHPNTGVKTVVVSLDDATPGQVYVYVGTKTNTGNPVEMAGLSGGSLYGIKVTGYATEPAGGIPSGTPFVGFNLGNVALLTGATLETNSNTNSVTRFTRPEDGHWDPSNPNDFYFVTTASFTAKSRLWRLRFVDPANPALGGTLDMVLEGPSTTVNPDGPKMMDNITVSSRGQILMQEDPGGQDHIAKIWRYSIAKDSAEIIAQHDPNRFAPGASGFLTRDEESSGIIEVSDILGQGWFLLDVQAHYNPGDTELVEGGQLLLLHFPAGWK